MIDISNPSHIEPLIGEALPVSDWFTIDQEQVNRFADVSGDHQWIHVDTERAARESPYGQTIVHGNLLLLVAADISRTTLTFSYASRQVNYGFDSIRFLTPVPVGNRVRLSQNLTKQEQRKDGSIRLATTWTLALEGAERPALIARSIKLVYP
ncbi:MAG: MaoC family dehydratase [Alphaproteobacteria bacterium]